LSWSKVSYIKDLAQKTKDRQVSFKNLHQLDNQVVINTLTQIKGIGPWTAEMFLMFTLGREDIFSYGDLGLKKGLQKLYKLKTVTPKKAHQITKIWSPYKSYGSLALWHYQDNT